MSEAIVVRSSVKKLAKELDIRIGGDFFEALDAYVVQAIKMTVAEVKSQKRQTLKASDLVVDESGISLDTTTPVTE